MKCPVRPSYMTNSSPTDHRRTSELTAFAKMHRIHINLPANFNARDGSSDYGAKGVGFPLPGQPISWAPAVTMDSHRACQTTKSARSSTSTVRPLKSHSTP